MLGSRSNIAGFSRAWLNILSGPVRLIPRNMASSLYYGVSGPVQLAPRQLSDNLVGGDPRAEVSGQDNSEWQHLDFRGI